MRRTFTPRGFTLVELMIVVVIFSILASVLVPGVSTLLSSQDVKGSAEEVRSLFLFARSQAAVENKAFQVVITPAQGPSGGILRVFEGTSSSCTFDAVSPLVREVELVSIVESSAISVDGATPGRIEIPTTTRITEVVPLPIVNGGICFRPDGSVRDAETNLPVQPDPGAEYGAGDVVIALQDHIVKSETNVTPQGTPLRILVPYSGLARITF